jgi:excisionase family DNA binding protein
MDTASRLLYDRKEAARQLSISIRSIAYILSRGELSTRRIGNKVLIPHAELVRYARSHHTDPIKRGQARESQEQ